MVLHIRRIDKNTINALCILYNKRMASATINAFLLYKCKKSKKTVKRFMPFMDFMDVCGCFTLPSVVLCKMREREKRENERDRENERERTKEKDREIEKARESKRERVSKKKEEGKKDLLFVLRTHKRWKEKFDTLKACFFVPQKHRSRKEKR